MLEKKLVGNNSDAIGLEIRRFIGPFIFVNLCDVFGHLCLKVLVPIAGKLQWDEYFKRINHRFYERVHEILLSGALILHSVFLTFSH